jgi:uncharacterized membrane protein YhhN
VVIAIFSTIYSKHKQSVSGDMKIPLILYLGIVIFMAALAIGIFTNKITIGTGMFAVGGTLFAISDNVLFAYKLGKNSRFSQNILLHIAYYLAQILIALSICWL